jgi:ADP-ribose pyrophosphatase YjhB (NUDIX family)/predicted transcriptional regulator
MSYEPDVHEAQTSILRALLFAKEAGFAKLQKTTSLSSDHFTFHIKKLSEAGLIAKNDGRYTLTQRGKEYANRMDTDQNEIEKQPKVSVALLVERRVGDRREFLVQQRLKHPYYGFYGRLGGKVRWGESFEEAAARELEEEAGLEASFTYKLLFHKRDFKKSDSPLLEDKLFIVMHTDKVTGSLMEEFEGGKNFWMTEEEFTAQEKRFVSAHDFVVHMDNGVAYHAQDFFYEDAEY